MGWKWHFYRWEVTEIVGRVGHNAKLDAHLRDGWEPFAVTAPGGVSIYHLRRIKHETGRRRGRGAP